MSGQNSINAFLPMRPANPQTVRKAAARLVASLSARQVLERKLLPGVEIYRAWPASKESKSPGGAPGTPGRVEVVVPPYFRDPSLALSILARPLFCIPASSEPRAFLRSTGGESSTRSRPLSPKDLVGR